jgi:hypothetical protein
MTIIKPKRSETANAVPTTSDIVAGEMAINIIDKIIYVRDSSNNIIEVANYSGGGTYSNSQVDSHLNTSTATTNQILSWDGSNYDWIDGQTSDNQKEFTASGSISAGDVVRLNGDGTVSRTDYSEFSLYKTLNNPNAYSSSVDDRFGRSVSISESYTIVGTPNEDTVRYSTFANRFYLSSGQAYIYSNSTGDLLYTLDNPNDYSTPDDDFFGISVAISESYAIVGANGEDDAGGTSSGKAYIYSTSTGNLLYTLDNPNAYDTSNGDNFGIAVSISESYAIVGAYSEDEPGGGFQSGKAYIYSTSTGNLLYTLDNPNAYDTSNGDYFGNSVSISESYAIVGAPGEDDAGGISSGKAYIYDTSTGNLLYTLDNPNAYGTSASDIFGASVAISESYAIVGAYGEDDAGGTSSGKAYIFSTSTGNLLHTLDNPNAYSSSLDDEFGRSVSISESYAIVGAYFEDDAGGTSSGKAYIYSTSTGNLLYTLDNPNAYDTTQDDYFGIAVSISESYAIVSANIEDDAGGTSSGKAYIYSQNNSNFAFLGIAAENISNGASGLIDLPGAINSNQSGLSIGSIYYLDVNGQLTSSSSFYGTVGRALSSTELQIFERNHEYYSTSKIQNNSYSLLVAVR